MLSTTDARGATVATRYDALGRVVETRTGSVTGPLLSSFVYDTLAGGKGVLTSATRYDGGLAYTTATDQLDAAGRRFDLGDHPPGAGAEALAGTFATTFSYKPDGSLASKTLPRLGDLSSETLSRHLQQPSVCPAD